MLKPFSGQIGDGLTLGVTCPKCPDHLKPHRAIYDIFIEISLYTHLTISEAQQYRVFQFLPNSP